MSLTGFQRRRRMLAEQKEANLEREEKVNDIVPDEQQKPTEGQNESQARPLSPDDVDTMDIEKVKELLEQFEVKFAHNTGEAKLREKLKDAIG